MLKIERFRARVRLSGELRSEDLDQVKTELLKCGPSAVLDLEEVNLSDVEGVRFLNECEAKGVSVLHCSPYIKQWMLRELRNCSRAIQRSRFACELDCCRHPAHRKRAYARTLGCDSGRGHRGTVEKQSTYVRYEFPEMSGVLDMNKFAPEAVTPPLTESKRTNLAQELFTINLWLSGLAILKYIPRSFRVKQVDGMAFFTDTKREEFRDRVLRITSANPRQWGTMNVSQMLHHLNLGCGSALGFYKLPDESYFTSRTLFRWVLVDWFPEQPVGLRLPKGIKIPHGAEFDFAFEKQQLLKILDVAWRAKSLDDWGPHPMFGKMSLSEWGKLFQIHIDYHLKQFAA